MLGLARLGLLNLVFSQLVVLQAGLVLLVLGLTLHGET